MMPQSVGGVYMDEGERIECSRDEILAMLRSGEPKAICIAVAYASCLQYFDEEVKEAVLAYKGSDWPVPFDNTLGNTVEWYLELCEG